MVCTQCAIKPPLSKWLPLQLRLDDAGVPLIEVTHGDGLGGNSVNYGFAAATDEEYLKAVIPNLKQAKVSALLLPRYWYS